MADFKRGTKAGLIAGAIYTIIGLVLAITLDVVPVVPPYSSLLSSLGISYSGGTVVRGMIFGVVFAALYNFLPGATAILKGVLLSLFLWILTVIEVTYINLSWPLHFIGIPESGSYYGGTIDLSSVSGALINVMSALLFGVLVGFLWNRFRGKELMEERQGRPLLLLSLIFGAIAWAAVAWPAIRYFVASGVSFTHVFVFPWRYVAVPVLFLLAGVMGWVFALIAWRRMRKGESGFSWGLAGGILMVVSGIMLLPGALAITGGAVSRRKAAGEPAHEQGLRAGTGRNLALLSISTATLAAIVITGFTMATPAADYATVALDQYSATAVSTSGLSLTISLNSTDYKPGEEITINIGEKNVLPVENRVGPADRWPVRGLSATSCGNLVFPLGISILPGYYDFRHVSDGTPLEVFPPCPFISPGEVSRVISYDFSPWSDHADIYADSEFAPWSVNMTLHMMVRGLWTGGYPDAVCSNFTLGVYTLVGGDEWGALVILHFTVS